MPPIPYVLDLQSKDAMDSGSWMPTVDRDYSNRFAIKFALYKCKLGMFCEYSTFKFVTFWASVCQRRHIVICSSIIRWYHQLPNLEKLDAHKSMLSTEHTTLYTSADNVKRRITMKYHRQVPPKNQNVTKMRKWPKLIVHRFRWERQNHWKPWSSCAQVSMNYDTKSNWNST